MEQDWLMEILNDLENGYIGINPGLDNIGKRFLTKGVAHNFIMAKIREMVPGERVGMQKEHFEDWNACRVEMIRRLGTAKPEKHHCEFCGGEIKPK